MRPHRRMFNAALVSRSCSTPVTAGPLSYSQSRDTFRPRRAVFRSARRTGLGRTAFVDFLERGPVRDRFVAELVSEGRPGCVVDALRHPGSGEFGGRHVANRDVIETPHQIERELMLEIGTGIRHLGVQLRDMPLVLSCPLRFRQLSAARRPNRSLGSFSPVESVAKSFRPRSMPTPERTGRACTSGISITMFRNQLPRASCAKLVPSLILPSGSGRLLNTRNVLPAKRNALPSRFRSRPFSGTQPSDFLPRYRGKGVDAGCATSHIARTSR